MNLHEMALGGVYLGPLFVYGLLAFILTVLISWGLRRSGWQRFVWHEALFGCAVFVLLLTGLVIVLAT